MAGQEKPNKANSNSNIRIGTEVKMFHLQVRIPLSVNVNYFAEVV